VDLGYKGVHVAFNFTPAPDGSYALDLLQRRPASAGRARSIARGATLAQALDLFREAARDVLARVESGAPAIAGGQAPAPQAAAPQGPSGDGDGLKIGVLTLPLKGNVGGVLQAHALMETLKRLGHQPVLINRRHQTGDAPEEPEAGDAQPLIARDGPGPRRSFAQRHILPISRRFVTTTQLRRGVQDFGFDAFVVGSDQVWRPKYAKDTLTDLFLGFLPDSDDTTRRISYAASFGAAEWEYSPAQTQEASRLARRFDAVSVREDSGVALARAKLGVEARQVLDPTLLLPPEHYAALSPPGAPAGEGRIVTYVLNGSADKARVVEMVSAALGRPAVHPDGEPFASGASSNAAVEAWLLAFRTAEFIVTDSFHGMAFSILFNRPFLAYANPLRGIARFTSLAKLFGVEDRVIVSADGLAPEAIAAPIDWGAINERLASLRAESLDFLRDALTGPRRAPVPSQKAPASEGGVDAVLRELARVPDVRPAFLRASTMLALRDNQRFLAAAGRKGNLDQVRVQLMFRAHALEKGLSHMEFRPRRGQRVLENLSGAMKAWLQGGRPADDQFFLAAASSVRAYFDRHEALGVDVSDYRALFDEASLAEIGKADGIQGGVIEAAREREPRPETAGNRSFMDVVFGRRSIREWTDAPVDDADIAKAVRIGMQAPSVCNRQAPRVHVFSDPALMQKALALQGGFGGYRMPPKLLLVTSDMSVFFAPTERNQAFVDGGLFMMALLLGLEQVGLGSCPLNTAMSIEKENRIREILGGIPACEAFIAFIATGHYDPSVLVPISKRVPLNEVLFAHGAGAAMPAAPAEG
jgi:nitroreductase